MEYIRNLGSVLVCYSGGTDSALLLHLARKALGESAQGIFFDSALIPRRDRDDALSLNPDVHIREVDIFSMPSLADNPEDRCYTCKYNILSLAKAEAGRLGLKHVLEGSHADDVGQHRPGRRAVEELGVLSPFEAVGLGKADIRRISQEEGLSTWDRPSYSCLITRLPHNEPVLAKNLQRIEALEAIMRQLGFREFRIRHRGEGAILETVPEEASLLTMHKGAIEEQFKNHGYTCIELRAR